MIAIDTNPFVEFFKSASSLLGFGLPGLAAIMIIVIGYVVIKRRDSKAILIGFVAFCAFVLLLFVYAGVGVVQQNKILADSTQALVNHNARLYAGINTAGQQLNISNALVKLQRQSSGNTHVSKDTLAGSIDTLVQHIKAYASKPALSILTGHYQAVSAQLKNNKFSATDAIASLQETNKELYEYIRQQ